jgi:Holliday junction resolvase RusA-like endonuclease
MTTYKIKPVPKPRMTGKDKWPPFSRAVEAYHAFKDMVALYRVKLPVCGAWVTFTLPIPKSRKDLKPGDPHQQVSDLDNLFKALGDAVYARDEKIWQV